MVTLLNIYLLIYNIFRKTPSKKAGCFLD